MIAAALLLGACGTTPAAPPATVVATEAALQAGGAHNDTDVMYLQMMVAHHEQGLEMVRLAEKGASRAELKTLAKAIDVTQSDELKLMTGWLGQWSKPTTVDHAPSAHADHGGLLSHRAGGDRGAAQGEGREVRDGVPEPVRRASAQRGRDGEDGDHPGQQHRGEGTGGAGPAVAHGPDPPDAQAHEQLTARAMR
nr:hypothetical protein GCM10020092_007430 [Actinoplanes digitatis]